MAGAGSNGRGEAETPMMGYTHFSAQPGPSRLTRRVGGELERDCGGRSGDEAAGTAR